MQLRPAAPPKKGLIEKVALFALVGLSVLSLIGVTLVTVYLNRLSDSTSALTRSEPMPAYVGQPQPVVAANGSSPMNFLVLVTSGNSLHSVVVANLSASRRNLTLITVPADLTVNSGSSQTLASTFAMDAAITVRAMEKLTTAKMDHQIRLDLDCLAGTIDATGGVQFGGTRMSGQQAVGTTRESTGSAAAATSAGWLIRAALISANDHFSVLDPARFSKTVDLVQPCLTLDSGLTAEVIQATLVESSVHPEDTRLWPLTAASGATGTRASPGALEALQLALTAPELVSTEQYHQAAFLPLEPPR
ncbi:LCP family protein [Propionicimonas sp.]|uniref:LCP family glycopolymer transferase n=2 Tax=Propionicimonas sp. TaxID=1955623 RepID=UPI0017E2DDF3|nr:LCP family protein [Propionicimonas sp.]MBU3975835.1 LCP family protein [Actinomycetota bacterium]MBA3022177.1 hypothetical protein [Propionicimonas sp.]MBU3987385.1 LCP family protein [Actinomycetota bacterium]MBU4006396.1 LCP family protein [Actinomycetota bacterium]MBU4065275.1 LCP family protein [Actinomycetota bacterium]